MILEIDAGNTRLKWRLLTNSSEVCDAGNLLLDAGTSDFLIKNARFSEVNGLRFSSVTKGRRIEELYLSLRAAFGEKVHYLAKADKEMLGVSFAYEEISRLGVDRCLAMVAAYSRYPEGVLVLDCGSAITVDYIDGAGGHLGGYILPGYSMLKSSLLAGTSQIELQQEVEVSVALGKSTEECVNNGVHLLLLSALSSCEVLAREKGITEFVVTGGDAFLLSKLALSSYKHHPDLVFEGLGLMSPFVETAV